jgi:hypothetical protein
MLVKHGALFGQMDILIDIIIQIGQHEDGKSINIMGMLRYGIGRG